MPWIQIPCLPYSPPGANWSAACYATEGYNDEEHTHWLNGTVEAVTFHSRDKRVRPNCDLRRN